MSELIAITYADQGRAAEVLEALKRQHVDRLSELDDACIVTRDADGKIELHQSLTTPLPGVPSGARWGPVIGAFILVPLVGLVVAAAAGAYDAGLSERGIDPEFIDGLSPHVQPGSSALFILLRRAIPKALLVELRDQGGIVQHTSVARDVERRLLGESQV